MKASRIISFLSLLVAAALVAPGCKNKCGSTTCQNGGTCDKNVCVCNYVKGFYGSSCQYAWSDPLIGTYTCSRSNCFPAVSGANSWKSTISRGAYNSLSSGFVVNITNFNNSNTTYVATIDSAVNGVNNLVISPSSAAYIVSASGKYQNGKISLKFTTTTAGSPGITCDMEMVKE